MGPTKLAPSTAFFACKKDVRLEYEELCVRTRTRLHSRTQLNSERTHLHTVGPPLMPFLQPWIPLPLFWLMYNRQEFQKLYLTNESKLEKKYLKNSRFLYQTTFLWSRNYTLEGSYCKTTTVKSRGDQINCVS